MGHVLHVIGSPYWGVYNIENVQFLVWGELIHTFRWEADQLLHNWLMLSHN